MSNLMFAVVAVLICVIYLVVNLERRLTRLEEASSLARNKQDRFFSSAATCLAVDFGALPRPSSTADIDPCELARALVYAHPMPLQQVFRLACSISVPFLSEVVGLTEAEISALQEHLVLGEPYGLIVQIEQWRSHKRIEIRALLEGAWNRRVRTIYAPDDHNGVIEPLSLWKADLGGHHTHLVLLLSNKRFDLGIVGGRFSNCFDGRPHPHNLLLSISMNGEDQFKRPDDERNADGSFRYVSKPWYREYRHDDQRGLSWRLDVTDIERWRSAPGSVIPVDPFVPNNT